jgi:hypothetical protein
VAGELTWPNSDNAAESHAASLLAIAEEGFVEGCVGPPPDAITAARQLRNLNEAPADDIRDLDREFRKAAGRWRGLPGCPSAAR